MLKAQQRLPHLIGIICSKKLHSFFSNNGQNDTNYFTAYYPSLTKCFSSMYYRISGTAIG